jgi:hypothetical protein
VEPEDREFMRGLTLRHQRATDAMIRALDERTDQMIRRLDEMRAEIAAGRQVLIDLHETAQAQNQAIFRLIDRLA